MDMLEVAPNIFRLSWAIDTKPISLYLVNGPFVTLVDTGLIDTPKTIHLPALERLGRRPEDVRLAVISHADADHMGGNAAASDLFPNLLIATHRDDAANVSDPATILRERYDAFAPYGLRYDKSVFAMLRTWMGDARPVDIALTGGERLRLLDDDWFEVVPVPGHTLDHIALVNRERRYGIAGDVCFGESQWDTDGNKAAPPPYVTVPGYLQALQTLETLELDLLLTCHYPVMRGDEIGTFLRKSREWVEQTDRVVREMLTTIRGQTITLTDAINRADPLLGPFGFAQDLQFALLAHFEDLTRQGLAEPVATDGVTGWRSR